MSIINQMLRELDARGTASTALPDGSSHVARKQTQSKMRMAGLGLLLLAAGGGAGVLVWSGKMNAVKPPAVAAISSPAPVSVPVAVAPPVQDEQQPEPTEPAVAEPAAAAAPALVLAASPSLAGPAGQAVPSPAPPESRLPDKTVVSAPADAEEGNRASRRSVATAAAPVLAQAEPAVVKKVAELTPEAEAQQYLADAQALRRAGKMDAAIGKYRLALERSPGLRSARLQLARLLQETGQADAALSVLRAGYEQQPDGGLAIAAGRLQAEQGRRDEALVWLERGRESLRPPDHALMGALLSQALRYGDAVNAYQRALASDPNQGGWWLGAGLALESLGRVDEAKAAYRNALERGEFKPDVLRFLRQRIEQSGL